MTIHRTLKHAGKTIKIGYDSEAGDPRKEFDNACIIAYWHRRYDLGEREIERCDAEEIIRECEEEGDPVLAILPMYLYDHSGITVSTGAFSCQWDSGQVGWAYITESKSVEMGFEGWTKEKLEEAIKSEIKTFDDYLTHQVYYFEVIGMDGDSLMSVGGFYGDINDCEADAKVAAEGCEDPAHARMAAEMEQRVTYASVV